MAKIQPLPASSSFPSSADEECQISPELQAKQAVYTVWMKSLVFNGNGCTVYGADGGVAYRVDNYGCRGGREVLFMDRVGNALIRIRRRGFFGMFRRWEAFRYAADDVDGGGEESGKKPWFRVRKVQRNGAAAVKVHGVSGRAYRIDDVGRSCNKSGYGIIGADDGAAVAAVARKQTASGVVLGEDVLTLTVGSGADHLLVLGLVVVRGLMNRRL